MTKEDIIQKVNTFLIEDIEIENTDLSPESDLRKDLGIDSLDFVDIVVIVEKIFGFKMKNDDLIEVKTLGAFYDFVERKLSEKK